MLLQPTQSKGENIMSAATMKNQSPKDETDIRALIEGIHKAHHNKDAATIVSPYAQDVVVCDLAPPLSHHGQDRESKQAWLDTSAGPIDREPPEFQIHFTPHFAFRH